MLIGGYLGEAGYINATLGFIIGMAGWVYILYEVFSGESGKKRTVEVENGLTIMEGAIQNNIPGIDADCGGAMACATCHVYVKEEWFNKLPKKEEGEEDMIDMAFEPNKFSRLSCQITVSDSLDGLVVELPTKQA